jgi:hypothetical protein
MHDKQAQLILQGSQVLSITVAAWRAARAYRYCGHRKICSARLDPRATGIVEWLVQCFCVLPCCPHGILQEHPRDAYTLLKSAQGGVRQRAAKAYAIHLAWNSNLDEKQKICS